MSNIRIAGIQEFCGSGGCAYVELLNGGDDVTTDHAVRVSSNRILDAESRVFSPMEWEAACMGVADQTTAFDTIFPSSDNVPPLDYAERAALEARMADGSMSVERLTLALPAGVVALSAAYYK